MYIYRYIYIYIYVFHGPRWPRRTSLQPPPLSAAQMSHQPIAPITPPLRAPGDFQRALAFALALALETEPGARTRQISLHLQVMIEERLLHFPNTQLTASTGRSSLGRSPPEARIGEKLYPDSPNRSPCNPLYPTRSSKEVRIEVPFFSVVFFW